LDAAGAKNLRWIIKYCVGGAKNVPKATKLAKTRCFGPGFAGYHLSGLFWNTVCQNQIILQLLKKFVLIWNTLKLLL
jgi:hypothetical protein